jgi:hypothetical protein
MTKRSSSTDVGKSAPARGLTWDGSMTASGSHAALRDSWQPGRGYDATWGPYYRVLFPPSRVTAWGYWKRQSSGVNVVRRHWDQREQLREAYESLHGSDATAWPHEHPGVVLDTVLWVAHAACLRCQWLDMPGTSMRGDGWREEAMTRALRHQESPENPGVAAR